VHSWVCDVFDTKVLDPGYLSLRGFWVEMELFWRDPGYNQRCWDELNCCRQGTASAHVYRARFRASLQKIRNKELNDFQIMTLLISNLSPSAAMYVRERMSERDPSYQRTGMMTAPPTLERVIEWASVRDVSFPSLASQSSSAAVVRTAVPALAPCGAGRGARSFPLRTDPSGASRLPLSPAEAREQWEKGALQFQQSYPEATKLAWPKPCSDRPPPSDLNCWNCGKRGHYSSVCPNERVIPREVVLASISWDFELYQAGLEMEGDDVDEYELYGMERGETEELMSFP
jgi:hypothetical protein